MTWNQLDFEFFHNFKKTRSLFGYFWKEYIRTDVKYLIKPFVLLYIALLGFIYYGVVLQNFHSFAYGNTELFSFQGTLVLNVIFFFWTAYFLNRTVYSKAFHIYQGYNNPQSRYKENLLFYQISPVGYSQRSLISLFISFFLGICLNFLYFYAIYAGVIGKIAQTNKFFGGLFSIFYELEIGPILIIGLLFLVPFQQFVIFLRSNNYDTSLEELKHSFNLLDGWKNKMKFFLLEFLIISILGFIMEGLFFVMIIVSTVILSLVTILSLATLFSLFLKIVIPAQFITPLSYSIVILIFNFCFTSLFLLGVELEGSLIGTLYGQTYINLTNPNLEEVQIKKTVEGTIIK